MKEKKEKHNDILGMDNELMGYILSRPTYDIHGNKIIYVNGVEVGRVMTIEKAKDEYNLKEQNEN